MSTYSIQTDTFNWDEFALPVKVMTAAKKSNPPCRLSFVIAKAKGLLTKEAPWHYLAGAWSSHFTSSEEFVAKELAKSWKKKYDIQRKKLNLLNRQNKEKKQSHLCVLCDFAVR